MSGYGTLIKPPLDPLRSVFSSDVLETWRRIPRRSDELGLRLKILEASGPYPSDPIKADEVRFLRARKAAWEAYLYTAFACGMFEGDKGKDLLARLQGIDSNGFRSAVAECLVCWFLAGRMKLEVDPCAPGRNGRNLDMQVAIDGDWTGVEVKAPFRETPNPPRGKHSVSWWGDDADKVAQCLKTANRQFGEDSPNLLVIVPSLRRRLLQQRRDLVKAAYGESKMTWGVDTQTGETEYTEVKFFPEGKFLSTKRPGGKPLKRDGLPAHRRISAILCIEEKVVDKYPFPDPFALLDKERRGDIWPAWEKARERHWSCDNERCVEHDVILLHNPYGASISTLESLFCHNNDKYQYIGVTL